MALCRRIAKPLKPRCSGGGLLQRVGCLQGACLARNPQVLRQAPQETSGSAHRPPAATFAFVKRGSVATSRGMPSFPRPSRFAEGIFYRWRIRKERAKRHIYPRATLSRFSSRASNTRAACCTRSGSFLPAEIAVPPAGAVGGFRRKISHAPPARHILVARD